MTLCHFYLLQVSIQPLAIIAVNFLSGPGESPFGFGSNGLGLSHVSPSVGQNSYGFSSSPFTRGAFGEPHISPFSRRQPLTGFEYGRGRTSSLGTYQNSNGLAGLHGLSPLKGYQEPSFGEFSHHQLRSPFNYGQSTGYQSSPYFGPSVGLHDNDFMQSSSLNENSLRYSGPDVHHSYSPSVGLHDSVISPQYRIPTYGSQVNSPFGPFPPPGDGPYNSVGKEGGEEKPKVITTGFVTEYGYEEHPRNNGRPAFEHDSRAQIPNGGKLDSSFPEEARLKGLLDLGSHINRQEHIISDPSTNVPSLTEGPPFQVTEGTTSEEADKGKRREHSFISDAEQNDSELPKNGFFQQEGVIQNYGEDGSDTPYTLIYYYGYPPKQDSNNENINISNSETVKLPINPSTNTEPVLLPPQISFVGYPQQPATAEPLFFPPILSSPLQSQFTRFPIPPNQWQQLYQRLLASVDETPIQHTIYEAHQENHQAPSSDQQQRQEPLLTEEHLSALEDSTDHILVSPDEQYEEIVAPVGDFSALLQHQVDINEDDMHQPAESDLGNTETQIAFEDVQDTESEYINLGNTETETSFEDNLNTESEHIEKIVPNADDMQHIVAGNFDTSEIPITIPSTGSSVDESLPLQALVEGFDDYDNTPFEAGVHSEYSEGPHHVVHNEGKVVSTGKVWKKGTVYSYEGNGDDSKRTFKPFGEEANFVVKHDSHRPEPEVRYYKRRLHDGKSHAPKSHYGGSEYRLHNIPHGGISKHGFGHDNPFGGYFGNGHGYNSGFSGNGAVLGHGVGDGYGFGDGFQHGSANSYGLGYGSGFGQGLGHESGYEHNIGPKVPGIGAYGHGFGQTGASHGFGHALGFRGLNHDPAGYGSVYGAVGKHEGSLHIGGRSFRSGYSPYGGHSGYGGFPTYGRRRNGFGHGVGYHGLTHNPIGYGAVYGSVGLPGLGGIGNSFGYGVGSHRGVFGSHGNFGGLGGHGGYGNYGGHGGHGSYGGHGGYGFGSLGGIAGNQFNGYGLNGL